MRLGMLPILALGMVSVIGYGLYMDLFVYTDDSPTRHDRAILARAERGEAQAQFLMGTFLLSGRQGIEPDLVQARRWFEAAAAQDHAGAKYHLGDLYRRGSGVAQDFQQAARLFEQAATAGDRAAQNALGDLYRDGTGVDRSPATALHWYRRAALAGSAPGQRNMGYMAAEGLGMAQDYQVALRWYRQAAAESDRVALSNLGIMYEYGQGIAADPLRAWSCYYRASMQSYEPARERRDALEAKLTATEWQKARELPCPDPALAD